MNQPESIFLVGPMGAGKTTVGRRLAKALKMDFFDSDRVIEERCGVDIQTIFDKEGEAGFRRRETQVLDELTRLPGIVLATGGGAVLAAENRANLLTRGRVVYLRCTVDEQLARTARSTKRPLLQTENPRGRLEELIAIRDPLYRQVAEIVVNTGSGNTGRIARHIIRRLGAAVGRAAPPGAADAS